MLTALALASLALGVVAVLCLLRLLDVFTARRHQHYLVARERWLADLRLRRVTHEAMRQVLDEARRAS